MNLKVYMLDWHIKVSGAFHEIFIDIIKDHVDFELIAWDGKTVRPEWEDPSPEDIFVFCQKRPPPVLLNSRAASQVVWLPMWNNVQIMTRWHWEALPKEMRIISYSTLVTKRAKAAGLRVFSIRYSPNVERFKPAQWSEGRILYYWNRVGMVNRDQLVQLCHALRVEKIMFRSELDPMIPENQYYELDESSAGIPVEQVPMCGTAAEAAELTKSANIFIAPRPTEGVGLTFLEAMAAGCATLAADRPTMSEYVKNGRNGLLLRMSKPYFQRLSMANINLSNLQNWLRIGRTDMKKLGDTARNDLNALHTDWLSAQPSLINFVLKGKGE